MFCRTKNYLILVILLHVMTRVHSQTKTTTSSNQLWLAYNNQTRFSNKWGLWADFHLRTSDDFFNGFSQSILRAGATYYLNDDARLTAGYAYVSIYPAEGHQHVTQPEHRPWQQVQWYNRYPKLRMMQWVRLEERFRRKILNDYELDTGYNFNFRVRYNINLRFPLSKRGFQPGTLSFVTNDELHVNFGKQVVYNYFDQNRFFIGFSYQLSKSGDLQFGYMNQFQQLSSGNRYRNNHVARIFYFHSLDLRKKTN